MHKQATQAVNTFRQVGWVRIVGAAALPTVLLLGACTSQPPQQAQQGQTGVATPAPTAASPAAKAASPAATGSPAARAGSPTVASSPAARVASPSPAASPAAGTVASDTGAAALRARLNVLLREHDRLVADATSAAIAGRNAELEAAREALNQNMRELGNVIESAYGVGVERTFEDVWSRHIEALLNYAEAAKANDPAQKQQALYRLAEVRRDLDDLLTGASPNLPENSVADLLEGHVMALTAVIDAQAANDPGRAYRTLEEAANHMDLVATTLANAIVRQFPDKFR